MSPARMLSEALVSLIVCASVVPQAWAADDMDGLGARIFRHGLGAGVTACAVCHGRQGGGKNGPRLAGLSAAYVMTQFREFHDGMRGNPMMHAEVDRLDVGQMRAVARYVARLPLRLPSSSSGRSVPDTAGRLLVFGDADRGIPACINCHGADLLGGGPAIPPLAGQQAAYLARQLRLYRDGKRRDGHASMMNRISHGLHDDEIRQLASALAARSGAPMVFTPASDSTQWKPVPQDPAHFRPPAEEDVPPSPKLVQAIREGERIFVDTPRYAARFTGNALSCANCHLDRGRLATAAPMWAALPHFPMYRKKNRRINTIQVRMQGCFRYSENGTPPPVDGRVMTALTAYLHWLSTGMPMGIRPAAAGFPRIAEPPKPMDRVRGRRVFMARCAMCHGSQGQGRVLRGRRLFPPLWGAASFNWGAGMHRVDKAASFIKYNMPYGAGGSLSVQEAWDVAAYVDSHPRPQDPRFTKDVATTAARFHRRRRVDFYGRRIDGHVLGAPGTPAARSRPGG